MRRLAALLLRPGLRGKSRMNINPAGPLPAAIVERGEYRTAPAYPGYPARPFPPVLSMRRLLAALLLSSCTLPAVAAESYDACVGFIDTLPVTISTQGNWCLRKDLATAVVTGAAITINANNVTIDCNGFKIGGLAAGASSTAIGIQTEKLNATVRNCAIRGFYIGISAWGSGHLVEDNRIDQSLVTGISVSGDGNLVQRNRIFDTGTAHGQAKAIWAAADIRDNTIDGVMGHVIAGIWADGWGSEVRGNRVRGLVPDAEGISQGIKGRDGQQSIIDNKVLGGTSGALLGAGITASGELAFCRDNLIANFTGGMIGCDDNGGNVIHGTPE